MSDYDKYVSAINQIYDISNKLKVNWVNNDNLSYIEEIENYKQIVISNAKKFNKESTSLPAKENVSEVTQ